MLGGQRWTKNDFIFKRQLGAGQFGVVYEALQKNSSQPVAIKIIPKNKIGSEVLYRRLKREIQIHSRINHEHICRMYGYFADQNHIYLVLEYCSKGNLYIPSKNVVDSVKQLKETLSQKKIASILRQLLEAIGYLSKRNIMHRDIKLQNILFDQDYNVKLTDFGCAVLTSVQRKTVCGTVEYLCPQMIKDELYDHGVDIYCLGIVAYELFYFQSPFYDKQEKQIYKNIKEGVIIFDDQIRILSQSARNFITVLLRSNPKPKVEQLLGHEFMKQNQQSIPDN